MIMISYQLARPFHFYSINILGALKWLWPKSCNKIYMACSETGVFLLWLKNNNYVSIHTYIYTHAYIHIYIHTHAWSQTHRHVYTNVRCSLLLGSKCCKFPKVPNSKIQILSSIFFRSKNNLQTTEYWLWESPETFSKCGIFISI